MEQKDELIEEMRRDVDRKDQMLRVKKIKTFDLREDETLSQFFDENNNQEDVNYTLAKAVK